MKVEIIEEKCISCGLCYIEDENMSKGVFEAGEGGISIIKNNYVDDEVRQIAGMCPTDAIVINDAEEELEVGCDPEPSCGCGETDCDC